jgi:Spherulation-specific family 4
MRKLCLSLTLAAVLVLSSSAAAAQLVPAYFYPAGTPNPWHTMCDSMDSSGYGSTAIMNPASGPGSTKDSNYASALTYCQEEDEQNVIGYVDTDYTAIPIATVEANVSDYYSWYPTIDGIFLDQMSTEASATALCTGCTMTRQSYYETIYNYIHTKSTEADVIGNPGTAASTAWQLNAPAADEVVTFEGSSTTYESYTPPSWVTHKSPNEIANLVYGASTVAQMEADCARAETSSNAGLVYVTNLAGPPSNPWEALPSYWLTETSVC